MRAALDPTFTFSAQNPREQQKARGCGPELHKPVLPSKQTSEAIQFSLR